MKKLITIIFMVFLVGMTFNSYSQNSQELNKSVDSLEKIVMDFNSSKNKKYFIKKNITIESVLEDPFEKIIRDTWNYSGSRDDYIKMDFFEYSLLKIKRFEYLGKSKYMSEILEIKDENGNNIIDSLMEHKIFTNKLTFFSVVFKFNFFDLADVPRPWIYRNYYEPLLKTIIKNDLYPVKKENIMKIYIVKYCKITIFLLLSSLIYYRNRKENTHKKISKIINLGISFVIVIMIFSILRDIIYYRILPFYLIVCFVWSIFIVPVGYFIQKEIDKYKSTVILSAILSLVFLTIWTVEIITRRMG